VIFAGPSISHGRLKETTRAYVVPPIRRGDLARFSDYDVFVIIDGEFGQSLAVSPKEILSLLDRGKVVIGSSSMGALRASELDRYGMIGVGWVYEHFASATVRRDDDVALAYSPLDLVPITIPTVDVEYWVTVVAKQIRVSAQEKTTILRVARRIFYAERTKARLMPELEKAIGSNRLEHLLSCTSGVIPDIKYVDARRAVEFADTFKHRTRTN
jgi:TfuA protein